MLTEAQKRAKKKYREKTKRYVIEFFPTDKELIDRIEAQPKKHAYIKNLIRQDIERDKL